MSALPSQAWGAIVVYGLPDPLSPQAAAPVVFTNGDFALPAELTGYTVRKLLAEIGGETFTANLRTPCAAGGSIRAVIEDSNGTLSAILMKDSQLIANGWKLESAAIDDAATSFTLSGNTAPTNNLLLWIEGECVKVTNVVAGSTQRTWVVTVLRGQCGSFAATHRVTPSVYWLPGSPGTAERIEVTSKPQPRRHRFLARAYRLRETTAGTTEVSHYRDGFLSRLVPRISPPQWEFHFEAVSRLIEDHESRKGAGPVSLSRCIEITEETEQFSTGGSRTYPKKAQLWLTAKEASLFLDFPFRQPGNLGIDTTLVTLAQSIYATNTDCPKLCKLTSSPGDGLYEVTSITHVTGFGIGTEEFILIGLTHWRSTIALGDRVLENGFTVLYRYPGGYAKNQAAPLIFGDAPPEIELWLLPSMTIAQFFARFLGSNGGDLDNAFDTLPPGVGLGLPDDFINWGIPQLSPSLDTLDLAELDQLQTTKYLWPIKPGTKPSDLLNYICRLLRLIVTPKTTGGMTLRTWARPFVSVANEVLLEQSELEVITDIAPLRALEFVSGIDLLTFEPLSAPRLAIVQSTMAAEAGDVDRVWVLVQDQNALNDEAFASGDIFECCRCFFVTLQGEPMVLRGMTDLDGTSYETVDYLTLTDAAVPTPSGRGVSAKRYIVISVGLSWNDSGQPILLLPDELNDEALQSTGKIAPTLRVRELRQVKGAGPYTLTVRVDSIGDATFDAVNDHSTIWDSIRNESGYIRCIRPVHNTIGDPVKDRPGWLECYVQIASLAYVGPESQMELTLAAAWLHDGLTAEDYFVRDETFITLMDVSTNNRLAFRVEPIGTQLYNGGAGEDFLKFDGVLPFDGHRSLIGA
jgi:hypothetical protein